MKVHHLFTASLVSLVLTVGVTQAHAQGSLTPSSGPTTTFKTLQQVEPRTDVQRLSGDATARYIISQPGSYYLTTNVVGLAGRHGISIRASNVTLDLNGFALLSYSATTMDAIFLDGERHNVEVRSGNIEGWGGTGVRSLFADGDGRFFNLRSSRNRSHGFELGLRAVVTECHAISNWLNGFVVAGGVVSKCVAVGNGYTNGVPIGLHGFSFTGLMFAGGGDGEVVKDCVANFNGGDGFHFDDTMAGRGTVISGCSAKANLDDGIEVSSRCDVRNNNCVTNGVSGIHIAAAGTGNRIDDNHVSANPTGFLCDPPTFGNILMRNTASANVFAGYVVPPANAAAVVTFFPGVGFVGASPWTNFEF